MGIESSVAKLLLVITWREDVGFICNDGGHLPTNCTSSLIFSSTGRPVPKETIGT